MRIGWLTESRLAKLPSRLLLMLVLSEVSGPGDDDFSSSLLVSGPYSFSKNSLGLEGFLWTSLVRGGGEVSLVTSCLAEVVVVMSTGRGENMMTSPDNNLDWTDPYHEPSPPQNRPHTNLNPRPPLVQHGGSRWSRPMAVWAKPCW